MVKNNWTIALNEWNKQKGGKFLIPKKGTKEYNEIREMMNKPIEGDGSILSRLKPVGKFIKNLSLFNGRFFILPRAFRLFLKENYQKKIINISIERAALRAPIIGLINLLTMNKVDKNVNELKYDNLFHLYIIITLDDNKQYRIERNQRLSVSNGINQKSESSMIIHVPQTLTLGDLFENYKASLGGDYDRMIEYDPRSANCQHFIFGLLNASALLTQESSSFVKQDTEFALNNTLKTNKFIENVVDISILIDLLKGM